MKSKFFIAVSAAIVIGLIVFGSIWLRTSRVSQSDNVIIISIDTCRPDLLSCYRYPRKSTPNIDKIVKKGILFQNATTPIASTLPAHSSMLTGTIPPYHGIHDNEVTSWMIPPRLSPNC